MQLKAKTDLNADKSKVLETLKNLEQMERNGKNVGLIAIADGDDPNESVLIGSGTFNRTRYYEIKNLCEKLLTKQ